ncbi:MAG: GNAT family N-acetyltransferase [Actinomycetota bacterium]|nr:GNAT family N-acetyltransferase [Actinomycetota bacterium]
MPSPDFQVRLATPADVPAVLAALSDGYGRSFTPDWFQWKHRESPWGRSRCWVADDAEGLLGAVFGLPWRLADDRGPVACSRLVDGATTVRSQRRGVFRAVVQAELGAAASAQRVGLVIATATPEARAAHVKNGAAALEPVRSYYQPVRWSPARVHTDPEVVQSWQAPPGPRLATAWDPAALAWRLDARGGVQYQVSQLAQADAPHGVVHRTVGGVARTIVVTAAWGDPPAVRRLLRALAWQSKAVAVLAPAGAGTGRPATRMALPRGESLLCVWDHRTDPRSAATTREAWQLDGLDVEGVM